RDARETLEFYAQLFHIPRSQRRKRIETLLEMVGLSAVAHRRVGEYSKGMQRRIGLAQALINDPDLLILDEPTSGLDPIGTKKIKDLIPTLAARGKTVILSSHLLADVEDVCDRITILYGGKQRATGTISQLLARTDQMQLTTDLLDEATVEQIEALIVKSGHQVREVSNPRHRLEELFLQIVAEANAQKVKTGGAATGGGVAAFLMGDDGRQGEEAEGEAVIEDLVKAAAPAPEPEEPPQAQQQQEPETQRDVLDELVAGPQARGAEELDEPDAAERMDAAARQPKVDRSVIDDLLGNDQDDEER
ncbi:MAG: ABC transporter ATP-binding protein, partial [Planctomycetota bacterium]